MTQPFMTAAAMQRNAIDLATMNSGTSLSMGSSKVRNGSVQVRLNNMKERMANAEYVLGVSLHVQSAIIGEVQRLAISFIQQIETTRLYRHMVKKCVTRLRAAVDDMKRCSEMANNEAMECLCDGMFKPYKERFMTVAGGNLEGRLQMQMHKELEQRLLMQKYCIKNWMDQKRLRESPMLSTLLLVDNLMHAAINYCRAAFDVASEKCYVGQRAATKTAELVCSLSRTICREVCGNECNILAEFEAHAEEFWQMESCQYSDEQASLRARLKPYMFAHDVNWNTNELVKFMVSDKMEALIKGAIADTKDDFIAFVVYALRTSSTLSYPVARTMYEILGSKRNIMACLDDIRKLPLEDYEDDGDLLSQGLDAADPAVGSALYDFGRLMATGKCLEPKEDPVAVMGREMRKSARRNGGRVGEHLLASLYLMSGNRKSFVEDMLRRAGLRQEARRIHHQPVAELREAADRLREAFIRKKGVKGWEEEMERVSRQMKEIHESESFMEQERKQKT